MKKITVLLLAVLATNTLSAQILDSLRAGAKSINYEVIAASGYEDFAAAPYGDQLLFVSSRETGLFSKKYDLNNQKFFDLYLYNLKTKEVTRYGDQLASLKKSKFHLGPATLLPDSAGVVLSRNYKIPNLEDEVNFYLVYENWSTNERYTLPFCTMANSFQHPFYDVKTRRLYFSANLPEGPGGYDIYYSEFLKDGSWGTPVIVQGINGPRDDVFPTVSKDGRLFFSRTESQMGLNIYAFDFDSKEITSLAAPINTSGDDFSLIVLNSDSAVFSQSQGGRYNTDLVLAWVKGSGVSDIELPNVIASTPNSDDGAAESAVLEGTDDGELTVAINTDVPSQAAAEQGAEQSTDDKDEDESTVAVSTDGPPPAATEQGVEERTDDEDESNVAVSTDSPSLASAEQGVEERRDVEDELTVAVSTDSQSPAAIDRETSESVNIDSTIVLAAIASPKEEVKKEGATEVTKNDLLNVSAETNIANENIEQKEVSVSIDFQSPIVNETITSSSNGELDKGNERKSIDSSSIELNSIVYSLTGSFSERMGQFEKINKLLGSSDTLSLAKINGELVAALASTLSDSEALEIRARFEEQTGVSPYIHRGELTIVSNDKYENYSIVVGLSSSPLEALILLTEVQNWAPDAFVSNVNGQYYVVSTVVNTTSMVNQAKKAASDYVSEEPFVVKERLLATNLPNLNASPDLVVYFKFDEDQIISKFETQIIEVMKGLPSGINSVFMVGHTDSRGPELYNDRLSRRRVQSVSNFINSNFPEFNATRILNHVGERNLINECSDGSDCDEYAHYLNRRVEIWFY